MSYLKHLVALTIFISAASAAAKKDGKVLSFFNVVKFPNDVCEGSTSRNGTCYTKEECEDRNGKEQGSCADGFGVCCIIELDCGGKSNENCTYLVGSSSDSDKEENCNYMICPMSKDICRIRLHMTTFVLTGPFTSASSGDTASDSALGDCITDTFSVSAGGSGKGSPVICGTNSDQHLFVDTNGVDCINAAFVLGSDSTYNYDIKVEQYSCSNEMAGPPGCLQYFTADMGTIKSFNFNSATGVYGSTTAHLSNQNYDICFRKNAGMCIVCYTATTFGLSLSTASGKEDSAVGSSCTTDFLKIPQPDTAANLKKAAFPATSAIDRMCGRFLNKATEQTAHDTDLCSKSFRATFLTDGGEVDGGDGANAAMKQGENELSGTALGTAGFNIAFEQKAC